MKKRFWVIHYLILISVILLMILMSTALADTESGPVFVGLRSEIYADPSGSLTIDEIISHEFSGAFTAHDKKHFSFGLSQNANWIRFRINDVISQTPVPQHNLQLYFDFASFADIRIYLPITGEKIRYPVVLKGGIHHGPERDDTGFVFSIFDLPANIDFNQYIYVRIQGPYTNNFQLVLTEKDWLEPFKIRIVLFLAFVFGIMGSMVFYNLVLFLLIKDKNYLWYVTYLFFMIIYQCAIAGIVKMISLPIGDFLTAHVVLFCFLVIISHLVFAWSFLNIRQTAPVLINFYRLAWVICITGALLSLFSGIYQANVLAYISGTFIPVLLTFSVAISYRNRHWVSKYYMLAVAVLLISVMIFAIRGFGLIEHSLYTSYIVLLSAAIESLLFSFALADRVRRLRKKHHTLKKKEKELSKISITDELTGLYNRRHFNNMLRYSIEYSHGSNQPLSLIFIDIDHFKKVNDLYGHQKGDEVLEVLGKVIVKNVRISDHPCRIGGEELAVIMLHTDISGAKIVAERIRQEFEEISYKTSAKKSFSSTISIGIAQLSPGESDYFFINRVDRLLYRAKAEGRNRIVASKAA